HALAHTCARKPFVLTRFKKHRGDEGTPVTTVPSRSGTRGQHAGSGARWTVPLTAGRQRHFPISLFAFRFSSFARRGARLLAGCAVKFRGLVPVHHIPPGVNVIAAQILIL